MGGVEHVPNVQYLSLRLRASWSLLASHSARPAPFLGWCIIRLRAAWRRSPRLHLTARSSTCQRAPASCECRQHSWSLRRLLAAPVPRSSAAPCRAARARALFLVRRQFRHVTSPCRQVLSGSVSSRHARFCSRLVGLAHGTSAPALHATMSQSHTFAHSCLLGSAETHYLLRHMLTGYESSTASNMDRCTSSLTVGLRAGCVASPWRVSWRGSRAAGRMEAPQRHVT